MTTHAVRLSLTALGLLGFAFAWPPSSAQGADDPKAVAALEKLGATIQRDDKAPGKPVSSVHFFQKAIKNDDLVHLKGVPDLKRLELIGTGVTDDGLAHIKGLTKLESLDLGYAKVTDAGLAHLKELKELKHLTLSGSSLAKVAIKGEGLAHLKGLSKLEFLDLDFTELTDEGLAHLKDLKELKKLSLSSTKVTDTGVADLKKALPKTTIRR